MIVTTAPTPASPTASQAASSHSHINLRFVYLVSLVVAIGGLLFGYDTGVIAGAIVFMEKRFALNPTMVGWTVSCALIGSIVGASVAGALSDWLGRKKVLIFSAILFGISAVATAVPNDITTFAIARMVAGAAIGIASMLSPLYIAEIAPAAIRGTLVSLNQLAIVTGFFVVYFMNMWIAGFGNEAWNIEQGWRWMFASSMLPSVLFLGLLFVVPESPRWLTKQGLQQQAFAILEKIGGKAHAEQELAEINLALADDEAHQATASNNTIQTLLQPGFRLALLIGVVMAVLQQVTGINAIMYYAPRIFEGMGVATDAAMFSTVLVGTVNLLFTFVALWLIDKAGRKVLLMAGSAGMALSLAGVGAAFYTQNTQGPWVLLCILAFVASFACSLGPVVWVVISEIFPTRIRGRAVSIATMVLWIATFGVSQTFPMLLEAYGTATTFGIYMAMSVVTFFFVWACVPETKGKSLEEIEALWSANKLHA